MSSAPPQVVDLQRSILSLPGVLECYPSPKLLEEFDVQTLTLPGEFGDLPQVALMRTDGGQANEVMIQVEIRFDKSETAWHSLEFLAWWVRDWARSHHMIQMRPLALPPRTDHIQLGGTLRFVIEYFLIDSSDDLSSTLAVVGDMAESIATNIDDYRECFDQPVDYVPEEDDDLDDDEIDFDSLQQLAQEGDPEAQYHLGYALFTGEGADEDHEQAFHWFNQSAMNGIPISEFFVGVCYAKGAGIDQDFDKALHHYHQAAEGGLPLAMGAIGGMYDEGHGVEQDPAEAFKWYQKGADLDDPVCKAELGECYEHGKGVDVELKLALKLYQEALAQGFDPVEEAIARVRKKLEA